MNYWPIFTRRCKPCTGCRWHVYLSVSRWHCISTMHITITKCSPSAFSTIDSAHKDFVILAWVVLTKCQRPGSVYWYCITRSSATA